MDEVKYDFYSLGIMAAVISFLGFVLENIWLAFTKGVIDNRNMNAPFLIGYGALVVGMYLILGIPGEMSALGTYAVTKIKNRKLLYFLAAMIIVSIAEILLGTIMEKACGIEYWNYTWIPMHITKYTSIPTSIGFAMAITTFMDNCFTPIMNIILQLNSESIRKLSLMLTAIMMTDFIVSFGKMYRTHSLNTKWQIQLRGSHTKFIKKHTHS